MQRTSKARLVGGAGLAAAVTMLVIVIGHTGPAQAAKDPTYLANRGKIVFQAKPFGKLDDADRYTEAIKRARRNKTLEAAKEGTWALHFIAFLSRPPGARKLNLVFYRAGGKQSPPVDYVEYDIGDAKAVMLQASATLTAANGFKVGDRIDAHITRLVNGREKRFASCRLTLR